MNQGYTLYCYAAILMKTTFLLCFKGVVLGTHSVNMGQYWTGHHSENNNVKKIINKKYKYIKKIKKIKKKKKKKKKRKNKKKN